MNIRDIAQKAGVSKSTVSRVLNDADGVSEKTRELVLQVVQENNFAPSAMARGLSQQGSCVIGVVLPDVDNSFFGKITQGIDDVLTNTEYTMILCCTDNNPERELRALYTLKKQRVRGVLITSSADYCEAEDASAIKDALADLGTPVILIDRTLKASSWDGVYSDNLNGAYTAVKAMIDHGFTRIGAFISDMVLQLGQERYQGFKQAMSEAGLPICEDYLCLERYPLSIDAVYERACAMIDSGHLPEAVFLGNAIITNGFYKAIFSRGLLPGRDVHCVGFDYSECVDIMQLPYSFLERNLKLLGKTGIQMLLDHFDNPLSVRREYIIPSTIHVDDSLSRGE